MPKHPADEAVYGKPVIKSCLMHPDTPSYMTIERHTPDPKWSGVTYGLCQNCYQASKLHESYRKRIENEVLERFNKLKQERENVRDA